MINSLISHFVVVLCQTAPMEITSLHRLAWNVTRFVGGSFHIRVVCSVIFHISADSANNDTSLRMLRQPLLHFLPLLTQTLLRHSLTRAKVLGEEGNPKFLQHPAVDRRRVTGQQQTLALTEQH
jgi:hypothetical protein